jgi:hypothetical protein
MADDYSIHSMSGAILQADEHTFCVFYKDRQGQMSFSGLSARHPSGGVIYFPKPEDWDRHHPGREGQRDLIFQRLREYLEKYPGIAPNRIEHL